MRLSTKYVFGMGALGILFLSPVFTELGEYSFIVLGFGIMIVGISFYYLLFAKEIIRGYNLEFEVSPDLTHFEITKRHSGEKTNKEVIMPETAFCAACGNEVYKPFRCQTCGQLLCGKHYLRGDHRC
ncbi:MAG: AN1-type zinc finger protein, partial [Candidatus Hodarchaeales archaeon]